MMKLFCIPFSGGNAYSYMALKKQLPDCIRCLNLELPGHGTRIAEPLVYSIEEMTDYLLRQIEADLDDEYALFGHSLGALLAFMLCRKLTETGKPLPNMLFVSGQTAPSVLKPDNRVLLSDDKFIEVLREMEGTPAELLSERSFLDFFLPIIKADFIAIANFRYQKKYPLQVPLVVLLGKQENIKTVDVFRWKEETIKETEFYWFEGGHFFIYENVKEICRLIEKKLLSNIKI
jgi:surfactin synthase thioesterase subunit